MCIRMPAGNAVSILAVALFLLLASTAPISAQDCVNWSESIQLLAQAPAGGADLCLAEGNNTYTCGAELLIWDVSDPGYPGVLGSWTPPAAVSDLLVVGDYLYLACGDAGVLVLDVADPTLPTQVSFFLPGTTISGLCSYADVSQLAVATDGTLYMLEPLVPGEPAAELTSLGQVTGSLPALYVAVKGDHALVTGDEGITIFELDQPSGPRETSTFQEAPFSSPSDNTLFGRIDISGNRAAVCAVAWSWCYDEWTGGYPCPQSYVVLLDISDPEAPFYAASQFIDTAYYTVMPASVEFSGDLVVVGSENPDAEKILFLNADDLAYTSEIAFAEIDQVFATMQDDLLLVVEGTAGLFLYDATWPQSIGPLLSFADDSSYGHNFWIREGDASFQDAYVQWWSGLECSWQLHLYDVRDPMNPALVYDRSGGYSFNSIETGIDYLGSYGDYCFLDSWSVGGCWFAIKIGTPGSMGLSCTYGEWPLGYGCRMYEKISPDPVVWVLDESRELFSLDLGSFPTQVQLGSIQTAGSRLRVGEEIAFLIENDPVDGIILVGLDLDDPGAPTLGGALPLPGWPDHTWIRDHHALLAIDNQFVTVDLADPGAPAQTGSYAAAHDVARIVHHGSQAVALYYEIGFQVFELGESGDLAVLSDVFPAPDCSRWAALSGPMFYQGNDNVGIDLYDLTDPAAPQFVGRAVGPKYGSPRCMSVTDGYLVAPGEVYPLDCADPAISGGSPVPPPVVAAGASVLHGATPNPFNPLTRVQFTLDKGCRIDLAVFDLRGHRVRTLNTEIWPDGVHEVIFDGKDDQGRGLASGSYFLRLATPNSVLTKRATLLR